MKNERIEELENAFIELKRLVRSAGRSKSVTLRELEEIFVRFNISLFTSQDKSEGRENGN